METENVTLRLFKMSKTDLIKDCLEEIEKIYQKFENSLDYNNAALQLQLDRAYASISACDESKNAVREILESNDIPIEIMNFIDLKNSHLLKK